ncbi:MAG: hypothetical protein KDK90_28830, partial [Leptospiraceae bacterium]|nr:hypothetical protein [Leptospiraceae bacterium]
CTTYTTNTNKSAFICGNIFALSLALITCTKSKDNFPFAAFTSVISPDTPSVNDAQSNNDGGGGGGGSANAPIEGLYFFHTDHLDSVTMIINTSEVVHLQLVLLLLLEHLVALLLWLLV